MRGAKPSEPAVAERPIDSERHSLLAVFDLIRTGRAATRLELELASGLGRAVVTDRLATLTQLGLIEEGERRPSMGGRAPRTVRLRADAGGILVANLDRSTLDVGLADLTGRVLFEHHEPADLAAGPEPLLARLHALFDWVLEQQDQQRALWGIGIGVPGAVETPSGPAMTLERLTFAPSWASYPAVEALVARHRAPVWVRSSIQMATMGEFGPPDPARPRDVLFVELGEEISAGIVSEGRLHRGAQGIAGQIGHIPVGEGSDLVCHCGNRGCLETLAANEAVRRAAEAAARDGRSRRLAEAVARGTITVPEIGLAAQLGDAAAAQILARCGRLIGTTLAALTNALNPSSIVLGGELTQTGDILLAAVREAVYRNSHPLATRDLAIVRSTMGRSAALAGAALIAVDELFGPDMLAAWVGRGTPMLHPDLPALIAEAQARLREPAAAAPARPPAPDDRHAAPSRPGRQR